LWKAQRNDFAGIYEIDNASTVHAVAGETDAMPKCRGAFCSFQWRKAFWQIRLALASAVAEFRISLCEMHRRKI